MGGGFGGKETPGATSWRRSPALAAKKLRRAGQDAARPRRRHDRSPASGTTSLIDYDVGFDEEGRIHGVDLDASPRAAASRRTSPARSPTARCSTADNAYFYPHVRADVAAAARPTPSPNTAFRGFGGPQGMLGDRARDGRDRLSRSARIRSTCARSTSTAAAAADIDALPPDGRGQHPPRASSPSWSERRLPGAPRRRSRRFNRQSRVIKQGHRADAGEVRHLLHRDPPQPGRRAGPRLSRTARST